MVDANTARLLDVDMATGNADTENDRQEYWPATRLEQPRSTLHATYGYVWV